MQIRDVMTHPVISVWANAPTQRAAELLVSHGFTALPVTDDDDRLIGIVTEADLLRAGPASAAVSQLRWYRPNTKPTTVSAVMSSYVESLTPGADVADAAAIMIDDRIRCLPIVDGDRIVGIITRRDLLRADLDRRNQDLADAISSRPSTVDAQEGRWAVTVNSGIVDIEEHLDNAEDLATAQKLAAAAPGVDSAASIS